MEKLGIDLSIVTEFYNNIRKKIRLNEQLDLTPLQLKILDLFNKSKNGEIELHILDLPSNINEYSYFKHKNFYEELKNDYNIKFPEIHESTNCSIDYSFDVEYKNKIKEITKLVNDFLRKKLFLDEYSARAFAYAHAYGITKIYSKNRNFNFNKEKDAIYKSIINDPIKVEQVTNVSGRDLYVKKEEKPKIYLDTNIFFYYTKIYKKSLDEIKELNNPKLVQIYNLFEDIKSGKVQAYSSDIVLQEINNSKKFINKDFYMIQSLNNKINFLNFTDKDNELTKKLIKNKIFSSDSVFDAAHLSVAINNKIKVFYSADNHFKLNSSNISFINKICNSIKKGYKLEINRFEGKSK